MSRFQQAIEDIGSRFYTAQEYPFLCRDRLPTGVLDRILDLGAGDLPTFAAKLKGRELDSLLFDLRDSKTRKEFQVGIEVLRLRFSPRLLKLISGLFQYSMDSSSLKEACRALVLEAAERDSYPKEGRFLWKFLKVEDIFSSLRLAVKEEGGDISKCCIAWGIDPESPFAKKSFLHYLSEADKSTLLANRNWMVALIEKEEAEELEVLIKNYLSSLDLLEYQDGVCLAIWARLGDAYESPDWVPYTKKQRDLMAQWNFLHLLKIHTLAFPEKFEILKRYYSQIRSCKSFSEHSLLVIDFGDVVVVDLERHPFSFFYQKQKYEEEMRRWEEEKIIPAFLMNNRKAVTARDFMIEKKEEPYMKLSYIGVDKFYVQELMDIKMGFEPDMRRKTVASIDKKSRRR